MNTQTGAVLICQPFNHQGDGCQWSKYGEQDQQLVMLILLRF
jgi:hypothetical protein